MKARKLLWLIPIVIIIVLAYYYLSTDLGRTNSDEVFEVQVAGNIVSGSIRANVDGFVDGDAVGIYVVNSKGEKAGELLDADNQVDHGQYTYNREKNQWIPMDVYFYKEDKSTVDMYGYYPYGVPTDVSSYLFEVKQDQSKVSQKTGLSA